jgi:hypothetical protein
MTRKKIWCAIFFLILILPGRITSESASEQGLLSIYFGDEKVGYEEYIWTSDAEGYTLQVRGRIDKPVPLILDKLLIRLNKNFIPLEYYFKGTISGFEQEISSSINDGFVDNRIYIAGQEQKMSVRIKRDAFLLPNSIFSPYMVLSKKYVCSLEEKIDLSAYIIPQLEELFSLEPAENSACSLIIQFNTTSIELETDRTGSLKALFIPSQKIKVIHN